MGEAVGDFMFEPQVNGFNGRISLCVVGIKLAFPSGSGKCGHAAQKTFLGSRADEDRTILSLDEKDGTLANWPLSRRYPARQRCGVARGMAEAKISQRTNVA